MKSPLLAAPSDTDTESEKPRSPLETFRENKKWVFLFLLCFSQLGQLYNSQAMPTLQVPFEREMGMTEIDYSHLVIAETMPGFVFPLIGGYLVDYFGATKSFLTTNIFIILGQSFCTLATYQKSFWVFILGKVIFNSAAEAATLARSKLVGIWYVNNDVGKALGAAVVLQTMAAIVCDVVYPNLYSATQSLGFPFFVGVIVCLVGAVICIRCIMMHRELLKHKGEEAIEKEGNSKISYRVIKKFPPLIWLLLGAASFGVDAFIIVKLYLGKWLQTNYDFSIGEAGSFLAASQVMTGVATPVAGFLTDRFGRLPIFLTLAIGFIQFGVFLTLVSPTCYRCLWPAVPIAFLSMGLGPILVAGYGSLLRIVHEKELGIATAMIPVVISAEVLVLALLAGVIADSTYQSHGYTYVFAMALAAGLVGLTISVITHFYDLKKTKKLQSRKLEEPPALLDNSTDGTDVADIEPSSFTMG